jgi:hypothetical protein
MNERKRELKHFRDLDVYQRAFNAAMKIYQITKTFPAEERYSLVDQIRRSSRAVCISSNYDILLKSRYSGGIIHGRSYLKDTRRY